MRNSFSEINYKGQGAPACGCSKGKCESTTWMSPEQIEVKPIYDAADLEAAGITYVN